MVWANVMEDTTTTITTYTEVDVTAIVRAQVGGNAATATGQVMAAIPEATDYLHIHFGVWADLAAAATGGSQDIAGLGIGFVQNFSGEGLTSIGGGNDDMPNTGDAMYEGNWVAAVRARDEDGNGPITADKRRRDVGCGLRDRRDHCYPGDIGHADRRYCREHVLWNQGSRYG